MFHLFNLLINVVMKWKRKSNLPHEHSIVFLSNETSKQGDMAQIVNSPHVYTDEKKCGERFERPCGGFFLQTATATTTLPASRVRRNRCNIFNSADLHTRTGQSTESWLGTGSWSLGPVTAGCAKLDVQSSYAQQFALFSNILVIPKLSCLVKNYLYIQTLRDKIYWFQGMIYWE
jgi:hypothetical protein